ncbi:DUF6177 family protein [Streptomyces sp. SPB162]|uniref:DUF6177 family protein n=1 Tax=Streptomyces sp. SPB162 TaxID=2940560 RepID=UPI002405626A|nr:DUF6177 family protein [Streptomyces sp. SPB162]MDF9814785.1 hypothetical protein [Streptomyces sp. SPB162]
MTKDVIALTPKMPDVGALLAGLYAGGPELRVDSANDGAVIQLRGRDGRPLVSVEAPLLVQVPGEAERLLGRETALPQIPFWWTEARASTAVPEAKRLAGAVAGRLALLLGGVTWPPAAGTVGVVGLADSPATDIDVHPAPIDAQPAVDVLTDTTAVILADRPVVALTAWLSDILRTTAESGHALQIVTPPHVRLSLPLRAALTGVPNRWVVQDPDCGYYDGLSGAVLHWTNGTFTAARADTGETPVAEAFTAAAAGPVESRQLVVAFRTVHRPHERLVLGRSLETAWRTLTGGPPAGWGTAEPINLPWSKRQLTDLARDRAPQPTQLFVVGDPDRPALASQRVTRTANGIQEDITLTLGYGPDEAPPLDAIEPLAATLVAEHGLGSMLASLRRARTDLSVPPHFEAPPVPISFTLGATDVRDIGLTHARRPPLDLCPVQLGPSAAPALHYPLGDGTDAQAWDTLQRLTQHLGRA